MDPHTRRFELLQLEFDSHTATVSDITDQIAISATEPSLQGQQFDKNGLVTLKGTTLESGKKVGAYVDAGCAAIVIAVPADSMNGTGSGIGSGSGSGSGSGGAVLKPEDVAKMAKPILINPKVHTMVSDVEMSLDWIL